MSEERELEIHQCECPVCQSKSDDETMQHHQHVNLLLSRLTEPQRRWYVATLSESTDSPGDRILSLITGLDVKTIHRGKTEMCQQLSNYPADRQRQRGGGRWSAEKKTRG